MNSRVNYPVKSVMLRMLEAGEISHENAMVRYCVSWFLIQLCNVEVAIFVSLWNARLIPGNCI